ncbi:MAG: formylglycine-generating enzyme family protein [Planctomycetaceae bacterium]
MYRMLVLVLTAVTASGLAGCQESPDGSTTAGGTAGAGSVSAAANPENLVPEPFESIPLASDTSHPSEAIPQGTQPGEIRELTPLGIKFVWCPPGTFVMGSKEDAFGRKMNEPQVEVTLTKGFWMQQTEVTQTQYKALMGINPAFHKGEQQPVESISWDDANEFCRRMSELPSEKSAGNTYRLPTEAEWEYACRAGTTTVFSFGDNDEGAEDYGWFNVNSERTTHPVAGKLPNPWGLYDMHGNVAEWCSDLYGEYSSAPVTDPAGGESGDKRVLRGGGWFYVAENARSTHRDAYPSSTTYVGLGFRLLALPSDGQPTNDAKDSDTAEQ